jgi:hypothetical protein
MTRPNSKTRPVPQQLKLKQLLTSHSHPHNVHVEPQVTHPRTRPLGTPGSNATPCVRASRLQMTIIFHMSGTRASIEGNKTTIPKPLGRLRAPIFVRHEFCILGVIKTLFVNDGDRCDGSRDDRRVSGTPPGPGHAAGAGRTSSSWKPLQSGHTSVQPYGHARPPAPRVAAPLAGAPTRPHTAGATGATPTSSSAAPWQA